MRPTLGFLPMLGAAAGLIAAGPGTALADVTPEDVWTNLQAIMTATGGGVSANTSSAGGALTVSDIAVVYELPLGAGSVGAELGTIVLTENGDGTVDFGGPEVQTMRVTFDIPGAGTGTMSMRVAISDYTYTAAGDPGDVTYAYSIGSYDIGFEDLDLTGEVAEELGEVALTGEMVLTGLTGTYRVTEGDLLTIAADSRIGGGTFDFGYDVAMAEDESLRSNSTGTLGAVEADMNVSLLPDGVSLFALADALRAGMSLSYDYAAEGQETGQETWLNGELMVDQRTSLGEAVGTLLLDATGISGGGSAKDYTISFSQPLLLPVPVEVKVGDLAIDLAIPLLQDADPQRARIKMTAQGIEIDPDLWAMFDPGAQLPRDPAALVVDVTAQVRMLVDLVDFETLAAMEGSGAVPAEIGSVDIAAIGLSAVGAAADVTGAFTFDNSDLQTFDGLPAPDGSAAITLTGVDALLDRLVAMGLAGDSDVAGARMMLGGFSRPGESAEERVIEIEIDGAAGTISANGQRLK